jgi:regulator of protease activity HflC (stomatin/prohibitin superfamily)
LENPEQQIVSYILNNVRQKAADLNMVELYQNRSAMEENVQDVLTEKFNNYGYIIENVLVDEPQPSTEVRDAFNRVIASEREKEAARNLAEAKKIELVGIATAEKESKKLQGEGISHMRDEIAKGLKAAIEQITEAGLSTQEAIHLLMDTNRLDTFSSAAAHGNMLIVDMNQPSDSLVNTLAAVKAANNENHMPVPRKTA